MSGRKQLVLRPYQELSKAMILDVPANDGVQGVGVWLDLGLGKTPTTLSAIVDSLTDRFDTTRWLVVGPKLVVQDSWPTQLERWEQFKGLSYRVLEAEDLDLEPAVLVSRMTSSGERKDQAVRKDLVRPDDIVVRRAGLNGSNP
ncbi:MAG TPA: hypothetical protein VFM48_04965, partial [Aquabacterium sp.]|nr:hypothetical protein [Aquabacterium sp.]